MASLMDRIISTSTNKFVDKMSDSVLYNEFEQISTDYPTLNTALSGMPGGGLTRGLTVLAGESKRFKSLFALLMAKAYLDKHPDGVLMFFNNEFGMPKRYFRNIGIDLDRVVLIPITNVEEFKFEIVKQLDTLSTNDKVVIVVDSLGNLASKKELDDALDAKSVADMSRAKAIKGLFRMITPLLTLKDVPMVVVNHVYKEQGLYPKDIVSGGTGVMLSADTVWIIGRQQTKDGKDVTGYDFIINVEKSRYVKEKSRFPFNVSWEDGLSKWSGVFDLAIEVGFLVSPKNGWYSFIDVETGEVSDKNYRKKDLIHNDEVWKDKLTDSAINHAIAKRYMIGYDSNQEIPLPTYE